MKQINLIDIYNIELDENDYCRVRVGYLRSILRELTELEEVIADQDDEITSLSLCLDEDKEVISRLETDLKRHKNITGTMQARIDELAKMELLQRKRATRAELALDDISNIKFDIRG